MLYSWKHSSYSDSEKDGEAVDMKKLPIGIDSFEKLREDDFYYIDKTGLIKELMENWAEVNLFTRPRRFGKSLNMSMLRHFFEIGCKKELFDGLAISEEKELCEKYMGQFPVIAVSLKGIDGRTYESACKMAAGIIGREARRHRYLMDSAQISSEDKEYLLKLLYEDIDEEELGSSLCRLSNLLEKHYGRKVVILIDEYDVPLAKASENGYYDEMVSLIRNMFGQALKTNDSLKFAVLTGCLRVSKESIFTGLNNVRVLSIADVKFDEYFGFTNKEVQELLEYYGLPETYDTVKAWYDGYHFGNVEVYCPWDVICYVDKRRFDPNAQPEEFWANTSGNDVIRRLIEQTGTGVTKKEVERLIAGEEIVKEIRQELTYREIYDSVENMWSLLYMTGYLTKVGNPEGRNIRLVIPNTEIRNIFENQVMQWFRETVRKDGVALEAFCEAFKNGDAEAAEAQFTAYLKKTISIRDTFVRKDLKENFYHGILLGLLGYKGSWAVWSNRETGDGYSDILVEISEEDIGIIIEVKYSENADLEAGCKKALEQIENTNYEEEFRDEGMTTILKYGVACYKKRCKVIRG